MKTIKILLLILILLIFAWVVPSCTSTKISPDKKHQPAGWFKNSNNPHHPATTNPGHTKWKKDKKKKHR